jgi:predicted TIM-barrel fold metal-dependent hydrolase
LAVKIADTSANLSINLNEIIAIDVITHAEVSCCHPHDDYRPKFDVAEFNEEVKPLILKDNAAKMLKFT